MNSFNSILITGGTGSFGNAFVRFLLNSTDLKRICIYSRGEHAQAKMRAELGDDPRLRWMIGDVRDVKRLTRAMHGVEAVVHAAALKRIETGAYNPDEMVKTNVIGTMNVIEAACNSPHVKYVVGISSDKAFQPISPYGQSKALAESLLLAANTTHHSAKLKFAAARYGNIWCAQGSVVPKWREIKERGENHVLVTDPECTRFFMTLGQATCLIWDILMTMRGGELVIPDYLPAYRLGDLVEAMGVTPVYTGLPEWEKRHESMREDLCSADAHRMTVDDLKGWLEITK